MGESMNTSQHVCIIVFEYYSAFGDCNCSTGKFKCLLVLCGPDQNVELVVSQVFMGGFLLATHFRHCAWAPGVFVVVPIHESSVMQWSWQV